MKFSLSNDSRRLIQQSTGLDSEHQCAVGITGDKESTPRNRVYTVKQPRDVAPRGAIYLQMGRIMPLHKVKSYLRSI